MYDAHYFRTPAVRADLDFVSEFDKPSTNIQVVAAARKLRSGSLEDRVFREQRIYELWTLSELMSDPHCRDELINHSLLPLIARFLAEDNVAGWPPQKV